MATKADLQAVLARHIGADCGISARNLAAQLDISERELRKMISLLIIEDGAGIAGTPASGYFIPATPAELNETVEFHKHRALHELLKASRLSGIPLLELAGQMRLKD